MLPFSGWVSKVHSGQPRNAVIVVWGTAALITCTLLPSTVAFTSLVSAAGVPSAAAYGLICLGRLFCTPKRFPKPQWSLGRWSKPFQLIGVFWNGWVVAVLFSPYEWPVTGANLNCPFPFVFCPLQHADTNLDSQMPLSLWPVLLSLLWFPTSSCLKTLGSLTNASPISLTPRVPSRRWRKSVLPTEVNQATVGNVQEYADSSKSLDIGLNPFYHAHISNAFSRLADSFAQNFDCI